MRLLPIRRAIVVLALAAAALVFSGPALHAVPRAEARHDQERPESFRHVMRQPVSWWDTLVHIWERAGLRIDDNG